MRAISIRRFEPRDLKRVAALEQRSFGADAWPEEMFTGYAIRSPDLFFVAEAGVYLAGYSITSLHREHAELASIAVSPRWRGNGIAKQLIVRSMAVSKRAGASKMWLTVKVDNAPAIQLYESLGFRRERRVKQYYEDGADGLRMARRLTA